MTANNIKLLWYMNIKCGVIKVIKPKLMIFKKKSIHTLVYTILVALDY